MRLVVGLGNPGTRYVGTRHNVGFMVTDVLREMGDHSTAYHDNFGAELARTVLGDQDVALLKPQTYMNRSGRSVHHAMAHLRLGIEDLLVIHDDVDLPFATVRVKVGGGSGGHRGLDSCFKELESRDFVRIRCGIGRPALGSDVAEYVLEKFDEQQNQDLPKVTRLAAEAAQETVRAGVVSAMNRFNRRTIGDGGEP